MQSVKIIAGTVAAALALGALSASAASAPGLLVIKEAGKPLRFGKRMQATETVSSASGSCELHHSGRLQTNESPTDKFEANFGAAPECVGLSASNPTEIHIALTSAGKGAFAYRIEYKQKLQLTLSGPCVYEFRELTAAAQPTEAGSTVKGAAEGAVNERHSAHSCAHALPVSFVAVVAPAKSSVPFELETKP